MYIRKDLGDFSSVVCLETVFNRVEDSLGKGAAVLFIRKGKVRGETLANNLGLAGTRPPISELATALDSALAQNGTRLYPVKRAYIEGGKIGIEMGEIGLCSECAASTSLRSTFTLGAVWGALETAMGTKFHAKQIESVLNGGPADKLVFTGLM